jgi:hypothetical protein
MRLIYFFAWIATLAGLCAYLVRFGLTHLYNYRVVEEGIEFRIFISIRLFVIRFDKIDDVFEQTLFTSVDGNPASIFRGVVIGNRLAIKYVVLKMKAGFFRYIGLTPIDRETFVAQVKRGLNKRSG